MEDEHNDAFCSQAKQVSIMSFPHRPFILMSAQSIIIIAPLVFANTMTLNDIEIDKISSFHFHFIFTD